MEILQTVWCISMLFLQFCSGAPTSVLRTGEKPLDDVSCDLKKKDLDCYNVNYKSYNEYEEQYFGDDCCFLNNPCACKFDLEEICKTRDDCGQVTENDCYKCMDYCNYYDSNGEYVDCLKRDYVESYLEEINSYGGKEKCCYEYDNYFEDKKGWCGGCDNDECKYDDYCKYKSDYLEMIGTTSGDVVCCYESPCRESGTKDDCEMEGKACCAIVDYCNDNEVSCGKDYKNAFVFEVKSTCSETEYCNEDIDSSVVEKDLCDDIHCKNDDACKPKSDSYESTCSESGTKDDCKMKGKACCAIVGHCKDNEVSYVNDYNKAFDCEGKSTCSETEYCNKDPDFSVVKKELCDDVRCKNDDAYNPKSDSYESTCSESGTKDFCKLIGKACSAVVGHCKDNEVSCGTNYNKAFGFEDKSTCSETEYCNEDIDSSVVEKDLFDDIHCKNDDACKPKSESYESTCSESGTKDDCEMKGKACCAIVGHCKDNEVSYVNDYNKPFDCEDKSTCSETEYCSKDPDFSIVKTELCDDVRCKNDDACNPKSDSYESTCSESGTKDDCEMEGKACCAIVDYCNDNEVSCGKDYKNAFVFEVKSTCSETEYCNEDIDSSVVEKDLCDDIHCKNDDACKPKSESYESTCSESGTKDDCEIKEKACCAILGHCKDNEVSYVKDYNIAFDCEDKTTCSETEYCNKDPDFSVVKTELCDDVRCKNDDACKPKSDSYESTCSESGTKDDYEMEGKACCAIVDYCNDNEVSCGKDYKNAFVFEVKSTCSETEYCNEDIDSSVVEKDLFDDIHCKNDYACKPKSDSYESTCSESGTKDDCEMKGKACCAIVGHCKDNEVSYVNDYNKAFDCEDKSTCKVTEYCNKDPDFSVVKKEFCDDVRCKNDDACNPKSDSYESTCSESGTKDFCKSIGKACSAVVGHCKDNEVSCGTNYNKAFDFEDKSTCSETEYCNKDPDFSVVKKELCDDVRCKNDDACKPKPDSYESTCSESGTKDFCKLIGKACSAVVGHCKDNEVSCGTNYNKAFDFEDKSTCSETEYCNKDPEFSVVKKELCDDVRCKNDDACKPKSDSYESTCSESGTKDFCKLIGKACSAVVGHCKDNEVSCGTNYNKAFDCEDKSTCSETEYCNKDPDFSVVKKELCDDVRCKNDDACKPKSDSYESTCSESGTKDFCKLIGKACSAVVGHCKDNEVSCGKDYIKAFDCLDKSTCSETEYCNKDPDFSVVKKELCDDVRCKNDDACNPKSDSYESTCSESGTKDFCKLIGKACSAVVGYCNGNEVCGRIDDNNAFKCDSKAIGCGL